MDHHDHAGMSHDHAGMGHDHSMHGHGMPIPMDQAAGVPPAAVSAHAGHDPHKYHLMQMSFHFGYNETVLLEDWKINSYMSLILSMMGIFILAILYEGLKCYRDYLSWRVLKTQDYHAIRVPAEGNVEVKEASSAEASQQMPRWFHCVQTVLHVLQVTVSMLLMLVFMTYNVWLCLSVIAGAGTGYFLFGWRRYISSTDVRQHCH